MDLFETLQKCNIHGYENQNKKGQNCHILVCERSLALYLYIPPHSCHASGLLYALILRMNLPIFQLCSKEEDVDRELTIFMRRLLDRGYQLEYITPKVSKAIKNAQ